MAQSPSHKFGQSIGNLLEDAIQPFLRNFCEERGLYLDVKGVRQGVRRGRKVIWTDQYGNDHDLDFVIERNGGENRIGRPVAFIEAAWRRYTKHSRNKAQEIQGAVLPIAEKYRRDKPFLGAVLAGDFTQGSLDQLESVGFQVLYFPYESVVEAFASVGLDARFDEATPDERFRVQLEHMEALSKRDYKRLKGNLIETRKEAFGKFFVELSRALDRMIESIIVIPLFGDEFEFPSLSDAIQFIESFDQEEKGGDFHKYEIIARYSNGDSIDAAFKGREEAVRFLNYLSQ